MRLVHEHTPPGRQSLREQLHGIAGRQPDRRTPRCPGFRPAVVRLPRSGFARGLQPYFCLPLGRFRELDWGAGPKVPRARATARSRTGRPAADGWRPVKDRVKPLTSTRGSGARRSCRTRQGGSNSVPSLRPKLSSRSATSRARWTAMSQPGHRFPRNAPGGS